MDTFRLILIFLGLAVLFVIYLLETQRRRKNKQDRDQQQEPSLDDSESSDGFPDDVPDMPNMADVDEFRAQPALHAASRQADPHSSPIGAGILGREAVDDRLFPEQSGADTPGADPSANRPNPFDTPLSPPAATSPAPPSTAPPGPAPENPNQTNPTPSRVPSPTAAPEMEVHEADEVPEPPEGMTELVVALQLSAPDGHKFSGRELQEALRHCNMEYGSMQIYHRYSPRHRSLFYLANAVEPGSFDLTSMATLNTPGILFFLRLPTVLSGREAFDLMLETAGRIAERLGGELQDQQSNPLGRHELILIRERIAEYEYKAARRLRELAAR